MTGSWIRIRCDRRIRLPLTDVGNKHCIFSKKMDLKDIFKQAQGLQGKLQDLEKELIASEVKGESGGGMVEVRLNGKYEVVSLIIEEQAYEEGREVLAELVAAAINNAVANMQEVRQKKQSEMLGLFGDPTNV